MRMITANRLNDGRVVFLTAEGGWSVDIADGVVIVDAADEERLFEAARSDASHCQVVDPNLIDVTVTGGSPRPVTIREAIRAFGPTV